MISNETKVNPNSFFNQEGKQSMGYGKGQVMPDQFVYNKQTFNSKSTTRTRNGEVIDHKREKSMTDIGGAIGMPDLKEHQTQLVEALRQVEGYENINFMDVIQYPDGKGKLVGMPEETLYSILNGSDAYKATESKSKAANQKFMEDNDLIKPDGTVKGYSYFDGKLTVDGETRDAILPEGAKQFNNDTFGPPKLPGGIGRDGLGGGGGGTNALTEQAKVKTRGSGLRDFFSGGRKMTNLEKSQRREKGGPITAGQSYLVGEKGPEMIVPSASGQVITNNNIRSIEKDRGISTLNTHTRSGKKVLIQPIIIDNTHTEILR